MKYINGVLLAILFSCLLLGPARAAMIESSAFDNFNKNLNLAAGGSDYDTSTDLEEIVATVLRIFLSILGTIFLFLMFLAGNDWMRSAGHEDKVRKSKDTIRYLTIGLALVLIAFAASSFVSRIVSDVLIKLG